MNANDRGPTTGGAAAPADDPAMADEVRLDTPVPTGPDTTTTGRGARRSGWASVIGSIAPAGLVASATWLAVDMVRASGPIEDYGFTSGIGGAAIVSFSMYVLPGVILGLLIGLAVLLPQRLTNRRLPIAALAVGVALLVMLRLILQAVSVGGSLLVAIGTIATTLAVLLLAVATTAERPGGHVDATVGLLLGFAIAVATQALLGTWDAVWRSGAGWAVTAVQLLALWICMAAWLRFGTDDAESATAAPDEARRPVAGRIWVLGPVLAVGTMTFVNPAFLASQSGLDPAMAAALLTGGFAVAVFLVLVIRRLDRIPGPTQVLVAIFLAVAVSASFLIPGATTAVYLVAAILLLPWCLLGALRATPRRTGLGRTITRLVVAGVVAGVVIVLAQLLYQLDYDQPLPFSNSVLPVAAALAIGLAAIRRDRPARAEESRTSPTADAPAGDQPSTPAEPAVRTLGGRALTGAVAAMTLAATAVLAIGGSSPVIATTAPAEFTLLDWNLHYSVSARPSVDLEEIAQVIEDSGAAVITLQEVNRGWVFGGGTDSASWLADRLGMEYAWAPAADNQFGNLLLSRYELTDVRIISLPFGQGPQQRSAISATIDAAGVPTRVTSVHLQHRDENTETRLAQIDRLLSVLDDRPETAQLIAGDMNAYPEWDEIGVYTADDFVSAQDEVGNRWAFTSPTDEPTNRIDYVFGRGVEFTALEVGTSAASDHFPLVARVVVS